MKPKEYNGMFDSYGNLKKDVVIDIHKNSFNIKDYSCGKPKKLYHSPLYESLKTVSHIKWFLFVLIDETGNTKCLDILNNRFCYTFEKKYKEAVCFDNSIGLLDIRGSFISVVDLDDYSISVDCYINPEVPDMYYIATMSANDNQLAVCYKVDTQSDNPDTQMMFAKCVCQNGRIILIQPKPFGNGFFDYVSRDMTAKTAFSGLSRIIHSMKTGDG